MGLAIGRQRAILIRADGLHRYERRVGLIPEHVRQLVDNGIMVFVQPSPIRIFSAQEYLDAGAQLVSDAKGYASVVCGVKQIPVDLFEEGVTYMFFSHTHKGQPGNMHMLRTMMENGCNLIDYEKMVDARGERVVAFGRFAGIVGMVDTLNLLGLRLASQGIDPNPFQAVKQTIHYRNGIEEIRTQLRHLGQKIRTDGVPEAMGPFVVGVLGYGRVSRGALEMFDEMGPIELRPEDLLSQAGSLSRHQVYKVIFQEPDTVEPVDPSKTFSLQDYRTNPQAHLLYASKMGRYLRHITALVSGIYWEPTQPRLVSRDLLRQLLDEGIASRLRVIGDIGADIDGPIASTITVTNAEDPYVVYHPSTHLTVPGYEGEGFACNVNDTAPNGVSLDASRYFSELLFPFVPGIVNTNWNAPYDEVIASLPKEVGPSVILLKGKLTPPYESNQAILEGVRMHGNTPVNHFW
ncbi:MAG: hypothetical protein WC890_05930 [Candidatus Margulisiibacteriota bacterium]